MVILRRPLPEATPAKTAEPAAEAKAKDKDKDAKKDESVRPGSFPVAEPT